MMIGITGDPLFTGGETGDQWMKPLPHNHQSIKCPRCDSSNTKFCYYNNYNLSQPRHFCKSCRRYWTKGGVLRNVPVGGGCRRNTKRSKIKPKPSSNSHLHAKSNSNSQSSSHNSGLTVTGTTTTATEVPETSLASPHHLKLTSSRLLVSQLSQPLVKPSFDPLPVDRSEIWPEIGSFMNLMTSSNGSSALGFKLAEISPYKLNSENQNTNQNSNQLYDVMDPTVEIELSRWEDRTTDVGFPAVDWQAADQEGMFDLTGNVDHSYWSQTQWSDHEVNDNPLNYIP